MKKLILFSLLIVLASLKSFAQPIISISSITSNTMTLTWSNPDNVQHIVIARKNSLPAITGSTPAHGTTYTANANFASGDALAGGRVVYFGTGTSVNITGLESSSLYHYVIIEAIGSGSSRWYLTNEVPEYYGTNSATTLSSSISAPTVAPSGPASATATPINSESMNMTGSFTNKGNGAGRLILMRPCEAPVNNPVNGVVYQKYTFANHNTIFSESESSSAFWVGRETGGSVVIDFGDVQGFNFTFANMPIQLAFDVFEYNGNVAAGTAVYKTTPLTFCADASSPTAPTVGATSLSFSAIGQNSLTLSWTNGNGTSRLVIARKSSEISSNPTNNTSYSANPVFGNGTALGGGFVVYNGSGSSVNVTGLDPASTYYFSVIEYLTGSGTITYASSLRTTGSSTTTSSSSNSDTDEDGVPDEEDQFPTNASMAFSTSYPAAGYGTLMFEDLWPGMGDYDFNDLVLNYRYDVVSNADDNVVQVTYSFVTRAIGGSLRNGFAFQLDGIPSSRIVSVSGAKTSGISYATINSNGTEANQTNANIIVFKNAFDLLPHTSGYSFINVEAGAPDVGTDTTEVVVTFTTTENPTAIANFTHALFNPYLIVNQERGKEVHKANRIPSSLMNTSYFGQGQDNSNPAQSIYYRTSSGLPWVLDVTESVPYAEEKTDFTEAFVKFAQWATSGGTSYTDWYQDLPTYRNTDKLF